MPAIKKAKAKTTKKRAAAKPTAKRAVTKPKRSPAKSAKATKSKKSAKAVTKSAKTSPRSAKREAIPTEPFVTRVVRPTSKLAPGEGDSRRLGLGIPRVVAWRGGGLLVGTSAGAFTYDLATEDVRQIHVGDVIAIEASAGGEIFFVDANRSLLVVHGTDGAVRLRVSFEHEHSRLACGALSPDGTRFAVGLGSKASALVVVDSRTGETVFRAPHGGEHSFEGYPSCVAFSPDGTLVATGNEHEANLWLWDAQTGEARGSWVSEKAISALAFTDGGIVATNLFGGGMCERTDRFLRLYDVTDGTVKREIDTPTADDERGEDLHALAVAPGLVAVGGEDGAIHVFDATWKAVVRLDATQLAVTASEDRRQIEIASLAFSPDGTRLAIAIAREANLGAGENAYVVEIWDTTRWERTHLLDDSVGVTRSASRLGDGRLAVATDVGLRVYAPDLKSHETVVVDNVGAAAVSPDHARAVLGSYEFDGAAQVVELATGATLAELATTRERVSDVAYGDRDLFAVAHRGAWIFELGRKKPLLRHTSHEDNVAGCAARGTMFAFASWDGTVSWLDPTTKAAAVTLAPPGPRRRLSAIAFSPDGTQLAVAASLFLDDDSPDEAPAVWIVSLADKAWTALHPRVPADDEAQSLEQRVRDAPGDLAARMVYADWLEQRGDTLLAAFVRDGALPSAQQVRSCESVTWTADGVIAAGDREGVLCFWDASTRRLLGMTVAHGGWITSLAPGPGVVYSASEDGTVGVWPAATRQ